MTDPVETQYWVRNEQGRTWGPYSLLALERLRGMISEKWLVALDGVGFRSISEFPELSELASAPKRGPISIPPIPREDLESREAREAARLAARLAVEMARKGGAASSNPNLGAAKPARRPESIARLEALRQEGGEPADASSRVEAAVREVNPEDLIEGETILEEIVATQNVGTSIIDAPIKTPPETDALAVPDEGDLESFPPVRLYALAALSSASGWLQLESAPGTMLQISFRRGTPEHVESDDPELSLVAFLRRRGTVTGPQAIEATTHAQKSGVDLVTALFQLQLIPPADAHRLLGEAMLALLDRALMIWRGRFSFERDAPAPPGAFPLGQRWTLLAESIRRLDPLPLRARLGPRLLNPVMRSGGLGLGRVEELALTAQEARLYAAIDGVRTGEELLRDSQDPATTLRLLYLLTELGHLSFGANAAPSPARSTRSGSAQPTSETTDAPPADEPRAQPAAPPARSPASKSATGVATSIPPASRGPATGRFASPGASSGASSPSSSEIPAAPGTSSAASTRPPAPAPRTAAKKPPSINKKPATIPAMPAITFVTGPPNESPAAMQARLSGILARIEAADHFAALGIDRKATAADVKRSFFQLARELHPDTVADGNSELRDLKQRLFTRVNEAAQILSDEKARKEHEAELDGKGNVDVARIFAAEEAFQRGEIMIKARKTADGLALIDEAISLNAEEGEFYAWRGWARFVLSKDRKAQYPDSVADCKRALAMIDKCVPAWLFLGNMAKAMGDIPEAARNFRKVVELDERNVEAQRELRAMGKKPT